MSNAPPTAGAAIATVARLSLRRAVSGVLPGIAFLISLLPVGAAASQRDRDPLTWTMYITQFVLAIVPPLFVASIGEEIEDRSAGYLWARPISRSSILVGKLVSLVPLCVLFVVGAWIGAGFARSRDLLEPQLVAGVLCGTVAIGLVAASIAVLVPRHGMALAMVYMLVDLGLSAIPGSVRLLSLSYDMRAVGGMESDPVAGAIGLAAIAGIWLVLAFRRINRLEI